MGREEIRALARKAAQYQCTYSPGYMKVPVTPEELRYVCECLLEATKPKLIRRRKPEPEEWEE